MLDRAENVHYTENLAIRVSAGSSLRLGRLTIRRTDVYRLREVRQVTLARLEPSNDEVYLFSTLSLPIKVAVGGETTWAHAHDMMIVHKSTIEITAPVPADVVVAVSQASVIRDMGLRATEVSSSIGQLSVNPLLGVPLVAALSQAFDLVESGAPGLDPRVLDFLHVMGRGVLQLPHDVEGDETLHPSVLVRVRTLVAAAHTDPGMTPARVADALGIPLRSLQRALSVEGTSVARELRVARARTARSLSVSEARRVSGAAAIAHEAGFGSVASMRRALREFDTGADANL